MNYLAAAALAGNRIENNTTGVVATVDNASGGFGFVTGSGVNFISNNTTGVQLAGQIQNQNISGNQVGVTGTGVIGGADLSLANDINGNVVGISGFTGTIQFSRIDGNGTGIQATSNLTVLHNLIYNNTTVGLEISGVANVHTSDNTFYTATGDNIRIENGSSNVEILNSILWALNGYDIYVANDSHAGYFSDYNTLFAGDARHPGVLDAEFHRPAGLAGRCRAVRPALGRLDGGQSERRQAAFRRPARPTTSSFCRWSAVSRRRTRRWSRAARSSSTTRRCRTAIC